MRKRIDNYILQAELGAGNYSKVFKGINNVTQQDVAIKMIPSKKIEQLPQLQTGIRNQISTLSKIDSCQHIVRYFDMLKTSNNYYFVYEYCNGGTLESYLKKHGPLPQNQAIIFFKQLLDGFRVLVKQNIMHRDIKTDNILIHDGVLKIADFGFCKPLQNQDEISHTMLGSPIYMAPQILRGQPYTNKADIWSIGVVFYRMLFGNCPYQSQNIAQLIDSHNKNDLFIPTQPLISSSTEQLLRKMLTKEPNDRIQWSQIFKYKVLEKGIIISPQVKYSGLGLHATVDSLHANPKNRNEKMKTSQIRLSVGPTQLCTNSRTPKSCMRDSTYSESTSYNKLNNGKINTIIKNHGKTTQIFNIVVQIASYQNISALNLAFQISFMVEKQIRSFLESIQREIKVHTFGVNPEQDEILNEFFEILETQISSVQDVLVFLSEQTGKRCIQTPIRQTLKQFLNVIRLLSEEQLILALQLIDYIQDGIVIKKSTYPRRSYQQLKRHVEEKKNKLLKC